MNTKTKTTIFTALLMLAMVSGAVAQEKYEYATVAQYATHVLNISIEGKPFEIQELPKDVKSSFNHGKLFEYISKMQSEGWEVFNTHESSPGTGATTFTFVMRKKKQ